MDRLAAWWWRPRRIMAAMVVAFFGHVAAYPQDYSSGTYDALRDATGLRWWGLALTIAGLAMLLTDPRRTGPVVAVGALLGGWCVGLLTAVATGTSQSPAGGAFLLGYVALLLLGAGRDLRS